MNRILFTVDAPIAPGAGTSAADKPQYTGGQMKEIVTAQRQAAQKWSRVLKGMKKNAVDADKVYAKAFLNLFASIFKDEAGKYKADRHNMTNIAYAFRESMSMDKLRALLAVGKELCDAVDALSHDYQPPFTIGEGVERTTLRPDGILARIATAFEPSSKGARIDDTSVLLANFDAATAELEPAPK